jgi:Icc-related predicted phosphoesterase
MKILCFSDTHGLHEKILKKWLVNADVLVFAGDITNVGRMFELSQFINWFASLKKYKHKIFIAGNHDWCFDRNYNTCINNLKDYPEIIYLQDQSVTIDGIKFYGTPHQPTFNNWAFNLNRGKNIREKWDLIPKDTNVLITHGPPYGIGDFVPYRGGEFVGCRDLLDTLITLPNLKANIFGHIHYSYGIVIKNNIQFINASTCNEEYNIINPPILIEI